MKKVIIFCMTLTSFVVAMLLSIFATKYAPTIVAGASLVSVIGMMIWSGLTDQHPVNCEIVGSHIIFGICSAFLAVCIYGAVMKNASFIAGIIMCISLLVFFIRNLRNVYKFQRLLNNGNK